MQGGIADALGHRAPDIQSERIVDAAAALQLAPPTVETMKSSFDRLWDLLGDALVPVVTAGLKRQSITSSFTDKVNQVPDNDWSLLII